MSDDMNLDDAGDDRSRGCAWPSREPAARRQRRAQAYGPADDVVGGDDVHLLDYVKVLYKRRWTAVTAFLLVVGGVTVYTFTATPIYEAQDAAAHRGGEPERRLLQAGRRRGSDARRTTTRRSTTSCRAARWRGGRSTR